MVRRLVQINIQRLAICCLLLLGFSLQAETDKFRCMWRTDPSTTMVIGWNQISGTNPVVYYGKEDGGANWKAYPSSRPSDVSNQGKDMNNHFARLADLEPNTIYYLVIKDSEGVSRPLSFKTAPGEPNTRLSVIAGGDSRNHREGRQNANLLVAKLRPHCVMFGGDMTGGDTGPEWVNWLNDWQLTIAKDGRMTPIIPARGNHERSNTSLVEIFDVPTANNVYALTLGGNLLRIYTLNSMMSAAGDQKNWLLKDITINNFVTWKFAQYHSPMRPHTMHKKDHDLIYRHWAPIFYKKNFSLVVESDAHVCKTTYPIIPSVAEGSQDGFIVDEIQGTVYVGEGCWGAPLRPADDPKEWTRALGSFNQFKWIFVSREGTEVRTIKTDNARSVGSVDDSDLFSIPSGLKIWEPETGAVIEIAKNRGGRSVPGGKTAVTRGN